MDEKAVLALFDGVDASDNSTKDEELDDVEERPSSPKDVFSGVSVFDLSSQFWADPTSSFLWNNEPSEFNDEDSSKEEIAEVLQKYTRSSVGKLSSIRSAPGTRPPTSTETRNGAALIVYNHSTFRPNYASKIKRITTAKCTQCMGSIMISPDFEITVKQPCSGHAALTEKIEMQKIRALAKSGLKPMKEAREEAFEMARKRGLLHLMPKQKSLDASIREAKAFISRRMSSFPPKIEWGKYFNNLTVLCDNSDRAFVDRGLVVGYTSYELYLKLKPVQCANFDGFYSSVQDRYRQIYIMSSYLESSETSTILAIFVMDGNTEAHYSTMLRSLQLHGLAPNRISVDMNSDIRLAARKVFPNATIRHCFQSFTVEVQRKFNFCLSKHGKRGSNEEILRKYLCLPLVNLANLDNLYNWLVDHSLKLCPELKEFVEWMNTNFLSEDAKFHRGEWNCWARLFENISVTNGLEDSTFYKFSTLLNKNRSKSFLFDFLNNSATFLDLKLRGELGTVPTPTFRPALLRKAVFRNYSSSFQFFDSLAPLLPKFSRAE